MSGCSGKIFKVLRKSNWIDTILLSEPCNVELSVVLCYNPDKDLNVETPDKQSKLLLSSAHVVDLTPAIKVELLPKAPRH